jgi:Fe-S-cluster-containing dehydrogenase component
MKTWHMIIDVALCHDCNDCFLADKDEFVDNEFPPTAAAQPWHGHRWMNIERKERGQYPLVEVAYLPRPCMHCDDPACVTGDGAVYKREDGLVIVDPVKAAGRKELLDLCPYGSIWWNEEKQVAQKCTGCAHLLDEGWVETRCTQVCPTGALKLLLAEDAEFAALVEKEGLEAYQPEHGTQPRVLYKNLYRWTRSFIAANVVYEDTDECAEGAVATASHEGETVGRATSNNFGDVVVDRLEPGLAYTLTVSAEGYEPASLEVQLGLNSMTVGPLFLKKAAVQAG